MADYALTLFSPHDVDAGANGGIRTWDSFATRFLAQGDSWFSIGAMPPWATSNILQQVRLRFDASAINCADPGKRLARMVDWKRDPGFTRLLAGNFAHRWSGILLSGGGNDLIAAAGVLPLHEDGTPVPPQSRLLLNPEEWGPADEGAARYLSDAGWETFSAHLVPQFDEVVALRDSGINKDVPLFCHSYSYPTPRDAPASRLFSMGPWLYRSVVAYRIPQADWLGVATQLIDRLAALLRRTVDGINRDADRHVHLVETHKVLAPAAEGSTGRSNDWENEIHPTPGGYRKLAEHWRSALELRFP